MSIIHLNPRLQLHSFSNVIFSANFSLTSHSGQIVFYGLPLKLRTVHTVLARHKCGHSIRFIVSCPLTDIASMRDSEIKHCQSWREHYYATEAEIKRRGKVTVKPPQRIDMHEAIVAERCETFVSKEMAKMPVPLKMAIRTENSRPEITGAGIANLRSTWDRRTMARPAKMTSAAKPRLVRYSN